MKIQFAVFALILASLIGVFSFPHASAESTPQNLTATANQKSTLEKLSEYGTLNYFGIYRGSSLSALGSPLQPRIDGVLDATSPTMLENLLTAGYKIRKDLIVGAVAHFNLFPWSDPNGGTQRAQFLDPTLFVSKVGLVDSNGFKVDTRLSLNLPLSKYDTLLNKNLATAVSAVFNARYDLPSSKLTVGTFSYLRGYIPTAEVVANAPSYAIVAAPYANYQLTDHLAATLWVDLIQCTRNFGTGFFSGLKNAPVDIEPGISWDITKNITFNPVLNIYPGHPTLASTSFQAFIIAKAF